MHEGAGRRKLRAVHSAADDDLRETFVSFESSWLNFECCGMTASRRGAGGRGFTLKGVSGSAVTELFGNKEAKNLSEPGIALSANAKVQTVESLLPIFFKKAVLAYSASLLPRNASTSSVITRNSRRI
jgi:hypothetical protein